jgi:hypothetical protein
MAPYRRAGTDASGALGREALDAGTVASGAKTKPGEPGEELHGEPLDAGDVARPSTCPGGAVGHEALESRAQWRGGARLSTFSALPSLAAQAATPNSCLERNLSDCPHLFPVRSRRRRRCGYKRQLSNRYRIGISLQSVPALIDEPFAASCLVPRIPKSSRMKSMSQQERSS